MKTSSIQKEFSPDIFYLPDGLTFWVNIMASDDIDDVGIMKEYVEDMNNLFKGLPIVDKHVFDIGFQIEFEEEDDQIIQTFRLYGATEDATIFLCKETYKMHIAKAIDECLQLQEWLIETDYYSNLNY